VHQSMPYRCDIYERSIEGGRDINEMQKYLQDKR
jgi:hypothetical protein